MEEYQLAQDYLLRARTKIIATVGPACDSQTQLCELVRMGVDVFRLNMAHGQPEQQQVLVDRIGQGE